MLCELIVDLPRIKQQSAKYRSSPPTRTMGVSATEFSNLILGFKGFRVLQRGNTWRFRQLVLKNLRHFFCTHSICICTHSTCTHTFGDTAHMSQVRLPRMGTAYFKQIYGSQGESVAAAGTVRWCNVRGVQLAYEVLGHDSESVPIVMTPGGLNTRAYLRTFARRLIASSARKLIVVLWDRRNIGLSSIKFGTFFCLTNNCTRSR
jgi:hypothetical protein